jgi:hypothetical protein
MEYSIPRPPEVSYANFEEFLGLQSAVRMGYATLIDRSVHCQMMERRGVRHWTEYDLILMGVGIFPELSEEGLELIMKITKGRGLLWCAGFNRDVVGAITTASRTYINTILSLGVTPPYISINPHIPTMVDMMKSSLYEFFSLSQTSIYPHCWVQHLVEEHFKYAFYNMGVPRLIVTKEAWQDILTAFLMVCDKYKIHADISVDIKNLLEYN